MPRVFAARVTLPPLFSKASTMALFSINWEEFAGHFFKVSGLGPCAAHAASDFRRKVVNIQEIAF